MGGWKKIVVAAALVVVIVVAVVWTIRTQVRKAAPPKWVMNMPTEKINVQTFATITKTYGEWKSLGKKDGLYKDPDSGEYVMADVITCASCGENIPEPVVPEDKAPGPIFAKYKCPKCGKKAVE